MMGLSGGRKSFPIGLAVLIQYRSVTDTQPASQPPSHAASHVAVAITLNAQASSLKSAQRDANTVCPPQSPHRRTESAMAVVRQSQIPTPAPDTLPGGQDRQNLISCRWSLLPPARPLQTDRTDNNTLRR